MKLLLDFITEAANKAAMNPGLITPADVETYSEFVKDMVGDQCDPASVAEAVHQIAEDDPKFGANPAIVPELVKLVCAKLCAMGESKEEKKFDDAALEDKKAAEVEKKVEKVAEKPIKEGWDNDSDDEDPDVRKAEDEVKRRKIKMMSPKAEQALSKKMEKADKKDEDKSAKKVEESVTPASTVESTSTGKFALFLQKQLKGE